MEIFTLLYKWFTIRLVSLMLPNFKSRVLYISQYIYWLIIFITIRMEERKSNTIDAGELFDDGIIDDETLLAINSMKERILSRQKQRHSTKFTQDTWMENASKGTETYYLLKGLLLRGGKHCLVLSINRSKINSIILGNPDHYQQVKGLGPLSRGSKSYAQMTAEAKSGLKGISQIVEDSSVKCWQRWRRLLARTVRLGAVILHTLYTV